MGVYAAAAGTLFGPNGPSPADMWQGDLGDCYFLSSMGAISQSNPQAIRNMFLDNGDGTWTVRFYNNGVPDYVTVNSELPVDPSGGVIMGEVAGDLLFDGMEHTATDPNNVLWLELAEKAYAQ